MSKDLDRILLLGAFVATLVVYAVLGWHGATDLTAPLRDILLALAGGLVGISLPRSAGGKE